MEGPYRKLLLGKIHGARITEANLEYEGSITIPRDVMDAAGFLPHEAVCLWNVTRGTRLETYILEGQALSREYHVNGAAAHLCHVGDVLIIAAFLWVPAATADLHAPKVVFLDSENRIKELRPEKPRTIPAS
jgi:aspartate 1-decarboxylase